MNKYLKTTLIFICIVFSYFLGSYSNKVYFFNSTRNAEKDSQIINNSSISLMIDFGGGNIEIIDDIEIQERSSLYSVLNNLANTGGDIKDIKIQNYGDMGMLLVSINEYTNGYDNNYWQYYVNNKQPMISIDKYILSDKDVVELKFTKSKF